MRECIPWVFGGDFPQLRRIVALCLTPNLEIGYTCSARSALCAKRRMLTVMLILHIPTFEEIGPCDLS